MKEIVSTTNAPGSIGPLLAGSEGEWVCIFLSGQVPLDPVTNTLVTGSIQEQTARVMQNLKLVLEAAGLTLEHVVKTSVFLKDMNDFAAMNEAYVAVLPDESAGAHDRRSGSSAARRAVEIDLIAIDPSA